MASQADLDDDILPPVLTSLLKYGISGAIAVYLVYVLSAQMDRNMRDIITAERLSAELMQRHIESSASWQRAMEDDARWHATMADIMRQLCVNGAKNYQERAACFQAGVR